MAVTPEREAEINAEIDAILGIHRPKAKPSLPKPVLVADHGEVVAVHRPSGWCTINMDEAERQQAHRATHRAYLRSIDPCRLNLYGPRPPDDEGE